MAQASYRAPRRHIRLQQTLEVLGRVSVELLALTGMSAGLLSAVMVTASFLL